MSFCLKEVNPIDPVDKSVICIWKHEVNPVYLSLPHEVNPIHLSPLAYIKIGFKRLRFPPIYPPQGDFVFSVICLDNSKRKALHGPGSGPRQNGPIPVCHHHWPEACHQGEMGACGFFGVHPGVHGIAKPILGSA